MMTRDPFIRRFESCRLPANDFDHEAHVRAAWLYLGEHGLALGAQRFVKSLKRFAAHHGAPDKYHDTVTHAWLHLIYARMQSGPAAESWEAFRERNTELRTRAEALLEHHYSPELLASAAARRAFVRPDREPLPGASP